MEYIKYAEQKQKGLITIIRKGVVENKTYNISIKVFSPNTGEENSTHNEQIILSVLMAKKAELQKEANAIDAICADCEAL